jgi:hypothetical protein
MSLATPAGGRSRLAGAAVLPALLAPVAVILARNAGSPVLLPLLATLTIYPVLALLVLRERRRAAAVATLLWAASLSVSVIAWTARDPGGMETVVLNGAAYRDEMFAFIRSGEGRESDPARFLPQHLLHLGAFCLLAWVSAGLFGIVLGALLLGYMSYYVGALAAAGGAPAAALAFGWPPWAVLRVVAFVLLGVALSEPLLLAIRRRVQGAAGPLPGLPGGGAARGVARRSWRPWYVAAAALLAADALLKLLLAPAWATLLRPCLDP